MFNNIDIGVIEGEPILQMVLLKEALKAQVAAYKEAIEEAVKVAAEAAVEAVVEVAVNIVVEALLGELGGLGKLVVIELNNNESKSHNKGVYAAFKEVIKVEDYEASNIEAL